MPEHRYFLCACARAVFLCGSLRGGYCVGTRGFFLFYSLYVVFLGREATLFFRGVVLLPPQAPPSTPALGVCCCVLHACVFSLQFTAGSLRLHAGGFSLRVPAGWLLRWHARLFSFLFSVRCFSGEGGDPLLQRRCSPPSPDPSLHSSTGCVLLRFARAHFFFAVHCGEVLRLHAGGFSLRVPAGWLLRWYARLFSFLFSVRCFSGEGQAAQQVCRLSGSEAEVR